jgi:hypothetical protein
MFDEPFTNGWWWNTGATADEIGASAKANNAYLTDLEIHQDGGGRLFSALMLSNPGIGWWWYFGMSPQELGTKAEENHAVPTRLATSGSGNNRRFATVLQDKPNLGWWWYFNLTADELGQKLHEHDAYPNDIVAYIENGTLLFAAILYPREGSGYSWYFGLTPQAIAAKLQQENAEPFRIRAYDSGDGIRYVAVMAPATKISWWYYGQDMENIAAETRKNCAYLTDLTTYLENGKTLYTCIMKERPQPAISRDHHSQIRDLLATSHMGGWDGFYLKRVNGDVLYGRNETVVFDPASSIKSLIHLHAVRAVQDRSAIGGQQVTFDSIIPIPFGFSSLPRNVCPFDEPNTAAEDMLPLKVSASLSSMMKRSRNAPTEANRLYFGVANVAATAKNLGLINTKYGGPAGCVRNEATLQDFGTLFEAASSGYLDAFHWGQFVSLALDVPIYEIDGTIDAVASSLPLLPPDFRTRFRARIVNVKKGGRGTDAVHKKSEVGYISLPFHNGIEIIAREYVYGVFVDGASAINADPTYAGSEFNFNWIVANMLRFELEDCVRSFAVVGRGI